MVLNEINFAGDLWLPEKLKYKFPSLDGLIVNLEAPVCGDGNHADGKICLRNDRDAFLHFFEKKPIAVCLANNHIMDLGEKGYNETIEFLESNDIKYYGAGNKSNNYNNPLCLNIKNDVIAIIGYVCPTTHPIYGGENYNGVKELTLENVRSDIALAKTNGAKKIYVSIHWGEEEVSIPKNSDLDLAEKILALGCDVIIGHHAHCIQPIKRVGDEKTIFFGIGNASFPDFEYRVDGKLYAWAKQRQWNKKSIVVKCDNIGVVSWIGLKENYSGYAFFDASKKYIIKTYENYDSLYKKEWRYSMTRLALSRFIARPKLPSMNSLSYIVNAIKKGK